MAVGHPTRLKGCPRRSNSIRWEETRAVDFFPAWLAGCGGPTTPSQRGGQQVGLRDVLRRLSVQAMRRAASSVISLSLPPPAPVYL